MITTELTYIGDFKEEADELAASFGVTDRFKTGHAMFDQYLGGGFGRQKGYEIVLLYGPTGVGKSLVALNFIAPAIRHGDKVGLAILEDGMADVSLRLKHILDDQYYARMNAQNNVVCLPKDALSKSWKLDDLLTYLEGWFTELNLDIILLDHLQFAFESADALKGENEYLAQREFMQKLNQLMKRVNKTIILVSHVNKGSFSGMDKIVGSGAIAQAATKVIELQKDKDIKGATKIILHKSRFTKTPDFHYVMQLDGMKLKAAPGVQD